MKLTIITINYNNALGLQKTMDSVLNQTSREFEYIVVDGAAPQPPKGGAESDIEVLQSFINVINANEIGFTRCTWKSAYGGVEGGFFSEPDSGIYNAMNKGLRMAKGEYVQFLNSGDLANGVVWCLKNNTNDELSVETRKKVLENFTMEKVAQQYIDLYKSLIKS